MTPDPQDPSPSRPKAPPPVAVKALACSACGAPLTVRAPGHSLSVVCASCGSVLDAKDPDFKTIERHAQRTRIEPRIPLGSRGKIRGEMFEVIGFLVRQVVVEGEAYSWGEYLLFNPYLGFRWLTEYQGHWTTTKAATGTPQKDPPTQDRRVTYLGVVFRHFQTAEAKVTYVVGEFPWRVRVGETAVVEDYIHPPQILSCERTAEEQTWSVGEDITGEYVWKAFGLPGEPPAPQGVGAIQPSPFTAHTRNVLRLFAVCVGAAILIQTLFVFLSQNRLVYTNPFTYERGKGNTPLVTQPFDLTGRRSNVLVEIDTDLANNWAYFNLALINEETGHALNFGREVSYYYGRDGGESWSEGGRQDRVYLPSVTSGRYYLLIEPESSAARMNYTVRVRRDVPRTSYMVWAMVLLTLPPLLFWYRKTRFEHARWLESDHPSLSNGASPSEENDNDT